MIYGDIILGEQDRVQQQS